MKKEPYFGSVRFFKNMILLAVILMILIPSVMVVVRGGQLEALEKQEETMQKELEQVSAELLELQKEEKKELGVDVISYQTLYPDFYAPEPLTATEEASKVIYLTFDDGPSERTAEILKILREKNVKDTFFVIGRTDEESLQLMKDIVAEGHAIAMHTYSHRYNDIYGTVEDYLSDMYKLFVLIKDTTGVEPSIFRFPGGSINGYNKGIYQQLEAEMLRRGFVPYDWNLSSGDASGTKASASQIVNNVVGPAKKLDRGIVLMHDSEPKTSTVEALVPMIDQLSELGFTFDKLSSTVKPVLFGYRD
ncbi:MAG: polysaccharide deacetylase family protein [Firmicutes bacterium]|nr:polysaccharide deacetylase family protein [Bacillota bacterium]